MSLATFRPRGVGEILDATFNFYRANFATCLTVAIIVVTPPAIIGDGAPGLGGEAMTRDTGTAHLIWSINNQKRATALGFTIAIRPEAAPNSLSLDVGPSTWY